MLREFKVLPNNRTGIRARWVFLCSYRVKHRPLWFTPRGRRTEISGLLLVLPLRLHVKWHWRIAVGRISARSRTSSFTYPSYIEGTLTRHPSFQSRSRWADTYTDAMPPPRRATTSDAMSRMSRTAWYSTRWRQHTKSSLTHQHLLRTMAFVSGAAGSTSAAARFEQR